MLRVRRRGRGRLDAQQRGASTQSLELPRAPQLFGNSDGIDRLAAAVQRVRGVEDRAVCGLVEVASFDARLDRRGQRLAREHHRAEE